MKDRLIAWLVRHNALILSVAVAVLANFRWFKSGTFAYGDWPYLFKGNLEPMVVPTAWLSSVNFGSFDLTLWRLPLNLIMGGSAKFFDMDFSTIEKFFVFWPTVIGMAIAGYLLVVYFTKSKTAGFIGSLVFSFNSYSLASNSQGHILLTTAAAFAVLSFYWFCRALNEGGTGKFVLSSILLSVSGFIDFRILYLTIPLLLAYAAFATFFDKTSIKKGLLQNLLVFTAFMISLNFFWLLPTVFSGTAGSNDVLNRSLFGSNYWSLLSSLSLYHPFWTLSSPTWFSANTTPFYYWAIPVASVGVLLVAKNNSKIYFFFFLALVGVFLSKQVDEPGPWIYPWLFANIPGFSAFREASKFYFYTIVAYAVLMGYLYVYAQKQINKRMQVTLKLILVLAVLPFAVNAIVLGLGRVGHLYASENVPKQYSSVDDFIGSQKDYFRTLWLPATIKWSSSDPKHPRLSSTSALSSNWQEYLSKEFGPDVQIGYRERIIDFLNQPVSQKLLNASSVKYVIVPAEQKGGEDVFKFYGHDRNYIIDSLNKSPYLRKVRIGDGSVAVYENRTYKPLAYATDFIFGVRSNDDFGPLFKATDKYYESNNFAYAEYDSELSSATKVQPINPSEDELSLAESTSQLVADSGVRTIQYEVNSQSIVDIYGRNVNPLLKNGKSLFSSDRSRIGSYALDQTKDYLFEANGKVYDFDKRPNVRRSLADADSDFKLYAQDNKLSLTKGSDSRPAQYPNNCGLWAKADQTSTIATLRRTVCVSSDAVTVKPKTPYEISSRYSIDGGQRIVAYLVYDNGKTSDRHNWNVQGQSKTGRAIITVPDGVKKARLVLEIPPDDAERRAVQFSLISSSLAQLSPVYATSQRASNYEKVSLQQEDTLSLEKAVDQSVNLVNNPSFESGTWRKQVSDCNRYDDKPEISMGLIDNQSSEGNKSLFLGAKRHVACTSANPAVVNEGESYLLTFDYKTDNAKQIRYRLAFDDSLSTAVDETVDVQPKKGWASIKKVVTAPYGAKNVRLTVYSNPPSSQDYESVILYDNFSLNHIEPFNDQYFVTSAGNRKLATPQSINAEVVNQTSRKITVNGAKNNFILVVNDAYDSAWKMSTNSGQSVKEHFKVNNSINAWVVDVDEICKDGSSCSKNPDNTYNFELGVTYNPQKWLKIGILVTLFSTMASLVLAYSVRRRTVHGYHR